jgi:hypothetical protein
VPLTAGGQLSIVASRDLGALGLKDGAPVIYDWVPSYAPLLLPLLALLGLLALKPNRCAAAWLIWLPIGCVFAISLPVSSFMPSDSGRDLLPDVLCPLAVGLGAIWLLANYLRRQLRILTFLCIVLVLAGFSVLVFVPQQSLDFAPETFGVMVALAAAVLATAVALSFCGLICRRRYRPLGIYVWLLLLLTVVWLLIVTPFVFFVEVIQFRGNIDWSGLLFPFLAAAIHFATLLPFLILSSASPFYRERLKALLNVKPEPPPVPPHMAEPLSQDSLKA